MINKEIICILQYEALPRTKVESLDIVVVACSKRSDSGERCEVKKAIKSRGLSSSSLAFIFSRSFLLRTAPHYLNAWNRLL